MVTSPSLSGRGADLHERKARRNDIASLFRRSPRWPSWRFSTICRVQSLTLGHCVPPFSRPVAVCPDKLRCRHVVDLLRTDTSIISEHHLPIATHIQKWLGRMGQIIALNNRELRRTGDVGGPVESVGMLWGIVSATECAEPGAISGRQQGPDMRKPPAMPGAWGWVLGAEGLVHEVLGALDRDLGGPLGPFPAHPAHAVGAVPDGPDPAVAVLVGEDLAPDVAVVGGRSRRPGRRGRGWGGVARPRGSRWRRSVRRPAW